MSESETSNTSDQGGTEPADVPAEPNEEIAPVAQGDTSPDPSIVADLAADGSAVSAVPVSDNKYSNQGYYLEDHGNQYVLRHSERTPFQIIIDPDKILADQPSITVPSPFKITKFVALSFDADHNVRVIVELQEQADQFAIVQNSPLQDSPGLYLGQPEL